VHDELSRAFAVLGLAPGSPLPVVRRRYRKLARTWHPDRFGSDPQGLTEATIQMRAINGAYEVILEHLAGSQNRVAGRETMNGPTDVPAAASSSLGSDRIDAIVDALNYRPSLRDRIGDDPWNTVLSLLLVGLYAGLVIRNELLGLAMPSISWVGILASPVFLHMAWSENRGTRVFGWFWLVTFTVVLPVIGFYFRWRTLGRAF
jgi:hypothetical protein